MCAGVTELLGLAGYGVVLLVVRQDLARMPERRSGDCQGRREQSRNARCTVWPSLIGHGEGMRLYCG